MLGTKFRVRGWEKRKLIILALITSRSGGTNDDQLCCAVFPGQRVLSYRNTHTHIHPPMGGTSVFPLDFLSLSRWEQSSRRPEQSVCSMYLLLYFAVFNIVTDQQHGAHWRNGVWLGLALDGHMCALYAFFDPASFFAVVVVATESNRNENEDYININQCSIHSTSEGFCGKG